MEYKCADYYHPDDEDFPTLSPYYRGFEGEIIQTKPKQYETRGIVNKIPKKKLKKGEKWTEEGGWYEITEAPIGVHVFPQISSKTNKITKGKNSIVLGLDLTSVRRGSTIPPAIWLYEEPEEFKAWMIRSQTCRFFHRVAPEWTRNQTPPPYWRSPA